MSNKKINLISITKIQSPWFILACLYGKTSQAINLSFTDTGMPHYEIILCPIHNNLVDAASILRIK